MNTQQCNDENEDENGHKENYDERNATKKNSQRKNKRRIEEFQNAHTCIEMFIHFDSKLILK